MTGAMMAKKKGIVDRALAIVYGNAPTEEKATEAYALVSVLVSLYEASRLVIIEARRING